MRRIAFLGLVSALVFVTLMMPPFTDATKSDKSGNVAKTPRLGQTSLRPVSMVAVGFAESAPVREIAKTQSGLGKPSVHTEDREELMEKRREKEKLPNLIPEVGNYLQDEPEHEINEFNREIIRAIDERSPGTPDAAIAVVPEGKSRKGGKLIGPNVMPTPNVSFNGIGNPDGCGGCLPPDTNGEIGPTQFVQNVNTAWRVFARNGTALTPVMSLGSLFAALPGPCANTNDGDPVILYDQLADRWLISQFCWSPFGTTGPDHEIIAISKTGDATGAYYLYDFVMPNVKFPDYPKLSVWPDGYYMTDNQFNQAGTQFIGAGIFAFDRNKMLVGDPTASFIYFDKAEGCPAACQFGGMLPSDLEGFRPPPAGAPNPIIQFDADEFGATDSLRIFDFHVDFATPGNSTLIERTGSPLAVAAFDPREVPAGSRNIVPQPAGSALDVISDRLMFRLSYRNMGTHESLAVNHSVNAAVNPAFRAGVRYYEIRKTTPAGPYVVQEQATMAGAAGDTLHRWMGSTALNNAGSQAVGYSVSNTTTFTSVRYAGRLTTDPPGSLAQGEASMVAGSGAQTSSSGRWGDYSDLTVDPLDDCTFWFTQEYYSATSVANWNTRIGSFTFGACPAIQKGVLQGTVTSSATANPINGATVLASNGFSRSSNASGAYNIDPMGAGTVTLTVSAAGYAPATVPGVVVTNGNTTTQDVQLVPLNNIVSGASSVVADSCNSNLTLDPNEIVTVSLPLQNIGGDGASTTNLVGTLQATGGVTNPSGPQTYGAVISGQPAVSKQFTFTVNATCGATVTATLQLQDGATNLGTRTYTFQVGTLAGSFPTTGAISVAINDNATVDIPITVPDVVNITDINVRVRANHTFDGDVVMSLIHPDNTIVALTNSSGVSGDNFGTGTNDCAGSPTTFDDQAATAFTAGSPPYSGSFRPVGSLATLNGKPANGAWKLRVQDVANQDVGTVGCVTLEINKRFVCCGPEVVQNAPAYTITAESITPANNAPDPNETVTVNFSLKNIGGNDTTNLVATLQPTGGVAAPSGPQSYGVVTASGPAVSRPFTFVATGACGGNIAATLALQDGATPLAPLVFNIPIGTTSPVSQSFSNTTAITIPATGTGSTTGAPATPYPSNINVAGMSGNISKVTVTIPSISHTFPNDVDMLLVGPAGQKYVFLSDVIGGVDWVNISYTLDDAAAALIPSNGAPASGTFRPTNYDSTTDPFPAPAPASPYNNAATAGTATFATVFNGSNPNGTWSLYVTDDTGTDVGSMPNGWTLNITTQAPVCNTQACSITCPPDITVPPDGGGSSAVVNYPNATPAGGCGVLNYSIPSGSTFPLGTTPVNVTGIGGASCSFNVTVSATTPPLASTSLAISEFRLRGAAGAHDEYIEIVNMTASPFTVNATDGSAGWSVAALNGVGTVASIVGTIPNGTVIPARGHYLFANSTAVTGYSLANYGGAGNATPDATYTTDIADNTGIALFNTATAANYSANTRIDTANFTSQNGPLAGLFTEGNRLAPITGDGQYAFVRKLTTGLPKDTGDNAADFEFVSTTAGTFGVPSVRGGPGPENLASPLQRNATIKASLIDPTQASTVPPNRIRDATAGAPGSATALGTLDIRRKFTNNTGAPVTRLRFRVVDITTTNTPSGPFADLRMLTSVDTTANGGTITILGTTLESPSDAVAGGGSNSSIVVAVPGGTLAPGASVNIRCLLGVAQGGTFRFFINVEALP